MNKPRKLAKSMRELNHCSLDVLVLCEMARNDNSTVFVS